MIIIIGKQQIIFALFFNMARTCRENHYNDTMSGKENKLVL